MRSTASLFTFLLLLGPVLMAQGLQGDRETSATSAAPLDPAPPAAPAHPVEETLHGQRIVDPYRWLETDSEETQAFQRAQLAYTRAYLDRVPARPALKQRLSELLAIGTVSAPEVHGQRLFYTRRAAGQDQPVLYARDGVRGRDRVLLDVNTLAADGTVALDWWHPSEDGRYVACGTSPGGSEVSTLRLLDAETGQARPDVLFTGRGTSVAWLPDSSGFYYSRYPKKGEVPAGQEAYNRRIWFHRLGDEQSKDVLIFGEGRDPQDWPSASLSKEGRWLLVSVDQGWTKSELYLKDLSAPGAAFVPVAVGREFLYAADMHEGFLYITTNQDAPRYRVFKAALTAPARESWKELIPESQGPRGAVLQGIRIVGGRIVARYEETCACPASGR